MSIDATTGEIVPALSHDEAERLTTRIALKLDAMADTYAGVMPLIREAIARDAHAALGYASVGAYVSERFGDALAKLGLDVRREVVRELTEAGLSTRAIGAVTGTSHVTASKDQEAAGVKWLTPAPTGLDGKTYSRPTPKAPDPGTNSHVPGSGQTSGTATPGEQGEDAPPTNRGVPSTPAGTEPAPEPRPAARATPRRALPDQFFDAAVDLAKVTERLVRLTEDDRFPQNAEKIAAKHRSDLFRAAECLSKVLDRFPSN